MHLEALDSHHTLDVMSNRTPPHQAAPGSNNNWFLPASNFHTAYSQQQAASNAAAAAAIKFEHSKFDSPLDSPHFSELSRTGDNCCSANWINSSYLRTGSPVQRTYHPAWPARTPFGTGLPDYRCNAVATAAATGHHDALGSMGPLYMPSNAGFVGAPTYADMYPITTESTTYRINPQTGKTRTKDKYRVVYTDRQRAELENEFRSNQYITIRRKTELASLVGLSERQVKIWFQNRRAKERKVARKGGVRLSSSADSDISLKSPCPTSP
uniref:Cdx protein n=1 Tax=Hofstenia miamia TaxID=442651 RepID=A0A5P8I4K6_HOFMI|nr:Cdx protein [Hofstenia miamia]